MKTYTFEKSRQLFTRAAEVIPCGIYGHMSPAPLVPATDYPFYAARAKGPCFWDVDGNKFIDYMCAYGPMVLGYKNEAVDAAAARQRELADCVTAPGPVMVELAEKLVSLIQGAGWAFFAKNGNDATTYALMTARAATGRKKIVCIQGGYHGVAPWTQSFGHHGVLEEDTQDILRIPWNDVDAFDQAIKRNAGKIAAFLSTPYHHPAFADNVMPSVGYWQEMEKLCRANGIVLIVDDIRCGFRLDIRGSHAYFGFSPDLVCFCKAIANGYPISALVGAPALKTAASKVFYTGSYWFSAEPMAAALATLAEMERINAVKIMFERGRQLTDGLMEAARSHGFELKVSGHPAMPYLRIADDPSLWLHQRWCGECTRRGAYFTSHHNWFLSAAHAKADISKTLQIADEAFAAVKKE